MPMDSYRMSENGSECILRYTIQRGLKMEFEIPEEIRTEIERTGGWDEIKKRLPMDEIRSVAGVMKALSSETRLKLLYALAEQRMCVCMLAELRECSYSKCSYHTSILKDAGLIEATNKGNYIIYALSPFGKSIVRHFNRYKPEIKK